jgi:hypothetical protein
MTTKYVLATTFLIAACACGHATKTTATAPREASADTAAQIVKAKEELGELAKRVGEFEMKNGHCPNGMHDIGAEPAPKDPWGNDVAYMPASPENPTNAFVSAGPDGQLLTSDDITVRAECSQ